MVTALSGLAGNARLPATAVRDLPSAGTGLDQAAVDARIKGYARTGSTDAIPDNAFTRKHDEIIGAFTGDGPQQLLARGQLARARSTQPTTGNVAGLTYGMTTYEQSPRVTNWWVPLRILRTEKDELARWQLAMVNGEGNAEQVFKGTDWTFVRDATTWSYYAMQVADFPVGISPTIEKFVPFSMTDAVALPGDGIVESLTALTGNARLPASAVRDLSTGGGVKTLIVTSGTIPSTARGTNITTTWSFQNNPPLTTNQRQGLPLEVVSTGLFPANIIGLWLEVESRTSISGPFAVPALLGARTFVPMGDFPSVALFYKGAPDPGTIQTLGGFNAQTGQLRFHLRNSLLPRSRFPIRFRMYTQSV